MIHRQRSTCNPLSKLDFSSFVILRVAAAAVLIPVIILLFPAVSAASGACRADTRDVLFEVYPDWLNANGLPGDNWSAGMTPHRDTMDPSLRPKPLSLPKTVPPESTLRRVFQISAESESRQQTLLERLDAHPGVVWCEKRPIRKTCAFTGPDEDGVDAPPSDPYAPLQWYIERIRAYSAWDVTKGDTAVVIAIVDVGSDIDHDDLFSQRWINHAEARGEAGVDDDGNGFIDDLNGWDFYDDDNDPRPENRDSHGTHVAGIAAAALDNGFGIAGVGGKSRIMAVRTGVGTTIGFGYEGVIYAAANGADVINLSWGSDSPSNIERITAEYAGAQGSLIIAAAGNITGGGGSFDHYPAAYDMVVGVAASDDGDYVPELSNYGPWVDITAPGVDILSTIPNDGYGLLDGTSMASPMVAGAAGLIKALHPDWTPQQVGAQLVLTADQIDDLNPSTAGQIGRGRLNLYRAVAENSPGFDLISVEVDDETFGNGNGIIEPNERLNISLTIRNLLTEAAEPLGVLSSDDSQTTINRSEFQFALLQPGEDSGTDTPFDVTIRSNARAGSDILCYLNLTGENMLPHKLPFTLSIEPPHSTHDNGSFAMTISEFGAIGYYNYVQNRGLGEGVRYPRNGTTALYHGSLMIGAAGGRVSDCAYGDSTMSRLDFQPQRRIGATDGEDGSRIITARYDDDRANRPLDIGIIQTSYSFTDDPDDDYVLINYVIENRSASAINDLYIALFLDWDVIQDNRNACRWDEGEQLGWMEYAGHAAPVFGATAVDRDVSFQSALVRSDYVGRRWTDAVKYERMQSGFDNAEATEPNDYWQLIGAGPHSIPAREAISVTFAIICGDNPSDLRTNAAAARDKWAGIAIAGGMQQPQRLELLSTYPSPFNHSVNVRFLAETPGLATWSLRDGLGRFAVGSSQISVAAGEQSLQVSAGDLPSGRYFILIQAGKSSLHVPVTLLK